MAFYLYLRGAEREKERPIGLHKWEMECEKPSHEVIEKREEKTRYFGISHKNRRGIPVYDEKFNGQY